LLGRPEPALADAEEAVRLEPQWAKAYACAGDAQAAADQNEQVRLWLGQWMKLCCGRMHSAGSSLLTNMIDLSAPEPPSNRPPLTTHPQALAAYQRALDVQPHDHQTVAAMRALEAAARQPPAGPLKIEFEIAPHGYYSSEDDDPSPYIQLEHPQWDLDHVMAADDVVIPGRRRIWFGVSYPLRQEYIFQLQGDVQGGGFTRRRVAAGVAELYQYIYEAESESAAVLNRGVTTEGRYGIYGHSLEDLVLHTVEYEAHRDVFTLGVDS